MGSLPGDWLEERTGVACVPMGLDTGPVDMTGLNLVRHHLQQAQMAAGFLPGGENAGDVMEVIFQQLYLTPEEAGNALRADLQAAMDALEEAMP